MQNEIFFYFSELQYMGTSTCIYTVHYWIMVCLWSVSVTSAVAGIDKQCIWPQHAHVETMFSGTWPTTHNLQTSMYTIQTDGLAYIYIHTQCHVSHRPVPTHVQPRNLFGALGAQDFPTPDHGCINFRILLGYWSKSPPLLPPRLPPPTGINPCTCNVYVYGRPCNRHRTTCVKYSILCPFLCEIFNFISLPG